MSNEHTESPLRVLRFNASAMRGGRGLLVTCCACVAMLAVNFLARSGLPPFIDASTHGTHPILSTIAIVSVGLSIVLSSFISIHGWLSPPRSGLRNYFPLIVVIVVLGFLGLFLGLYP